MTNDAIKILGTNQRTYPDQASPVGGVTVVTVLVAGEIGDYAAYSGRGLPDWVARHGDKIPFEEACVHFPGSQLKRELYRL